jgi:hypothetical protein
VLVAVLWLILCAVILIGLPAACAFIPEGHDNGYVHHSGDEPAADDEPDVMLTAA